MTISNETNKSGPYLYNGATTSFPYGFKISDDTHIRIVEAVIATGVETDLVLGADYTVTGVSADSGTFVISPARAAGKTVTAVRAVSFTQQTVLENQGAYFAKVVEAALDNGVARDQQLQEQISRAVVVPISADPTDIDALIGGVVSLLDNVAAVVTVAGIAPAVSTVAVVSADVTTVAAIGADVAAVAANETNIETVAGMAADIGTVVANVTSIQDAPGEAADAAASAVAAAASAASVDVTSMDWRRNLSVNGSLNDSQERGSTLGTTSGYFYACQKVLYRSSDLAGKISAQRVAYTSLEGGSKAGEFKCVSTATVIANSLATDTDFIEGADPEFVAAGWGAAGAKAIMYRKEVQKPAGTYSFHVTNRTGDRHLWIQYVIAPGDANVPVVVEVQIPGDTSGTWSKAEGEIGCTIDDVLVLGTNYIGGTEGIWGVPDYQGGAGQKNFLDNTANVARHTDFGARLDPDATGVYGAYRVGEVDAKFGPERYVFYWGVSAAGYTSFVSGQCESTTQFSGLFQLPQAMPAAMIFDASVGSNFAVYSAGSITSVSTGLTVVSVLSDRRTIGIGAAVASGLVAGRAASLRNSAGNSPRIGIRARLQ